MPLDLSVFFAYSLCRLHPGLLSVCLCRLSFYLCACVRACVRASARVHTLGTLCVCDKQPRGGEKRHLINYAGGGRVTWTAAGIKICTKLNT